MIPLFCKFNYNEIIPSQSEGTRLSIFNLLIRKFILPKGEFML